LYSILKLEQNKTQRRDNIMLKFSENLSKEENIKGVAKSNRMSLEDVTEAYKIWKEDYLNGGYKNIDRNSFAWSKEAILKLRTRLAKKYEEERKEVSEIEGNSKKQYKTNNVRVYCSETKRRYKSLTEAAILTGISINSISKNINGYCKTAHGLHFKKIWEA